MAALNICGITKYYGSSLVIKDINLEISENEKVGLIGPNGAGKTTLFKIITGEEEHDEGYYVYGKDISVGYLRQTNELTQKITLYEQLKSSLKHLYCLKEELVQLEQEMQREEIKNNPQSLDRVMERYSRQVNIFENQGGYTMENRIRQVASGLGFTPEDLERPVISFSGGEKTSLYLASLLLERHDLLLLDEPTNYLDSRAMEWLEDYLKSWPGALLVISHDRYFLDRVVNHIAALESRSLKRYKGNYSEYKKQYEVEGLSLQRTLKKQHSLIKKEEALIRTSGAGERDKRQARSREKRLQRLEKVDQGPREKSISLSFEFSGRAGQEVVVFQEVAKVFDGTALFKGASFTLKWGDKAALIGPNGSGKTTLLKMITGTLEPSRGQVKIGPSVKISYFDQEQAQLNPAKTLLEDIMDYYDSFTLTEARSYLGRYLFKGDEVFKKIGDLSGGEKSRLVLARTALSQGNFLILDEPTNHLDIKGMTELEQALTLYQGTLLVVSHDRYFIDGLADKILEIENGKVGLYPFGYQEYLEHKSRVKEANKVSGSKKSETNREARLREREQREEMLARRREKRALESRINELEDIIEAAENRALQLEEKMADPDIYDNFDEVRKVNEEHRRLKEKLENYYHQWEKITVMIEKNP
ncbi:ABC-F family ATP-binding cassette domain-containing protein [Candidatus Contubernalis alkaliaceticus]|uniref:ABC-F family ATP-binding cassette domain-containing protein n=1 Tax=Candidatus Contubernalis alkaliaceticus TaxID=338645 RepID=UPI001F4BD09A|nr:ABC-F family ATP-binding cassette domain-containing protein [Candidatus Contubernalis alkalaceticus]UNC91593.1 ABC-F family ATP-binding cassette domain-containing protein [Candidatus Contubernalis alkalaceticus]